MEGWSLPPETAIEPAVEEPFTRVTGGAKGKAKPRSIGQAQDNGWPAVAATTKATKKSKGKPGAAAAAASRRSSYSYRSASSDDGDDDESSDDFNDVQESEPVRQPERKAAATTAAATAAAAASTAAAAAAAQLSEEQAAAALQERNRRLIKMMMKEAGGDSQKMGQAKEISMRFKKNEMGPASYLDELAVLFPEDSLDAFVDDLAALLKNPAKREALRKAITAFRLRRRQGKAAGGTGGGSMWSCSGCTFANDSEEDRCEMCAKWR